MKSRHLLRFALAAALGASPAFAQEPPAQDAFTQASADVDMHPEYAKSLARLAYVWGYPMVNVINRRASVTKAPQPGLLGGVLPVAPRGQLAMLHDYIDPAQKFVACPNQDVVYGLGFFSLDEEPVVLQVPDFGDRFYVYAIYDARTEQVGEIGKPYDSKPGFYLLKGPNWKGTVPEGITGVIESPTELANCVPRVFMNDTREDRDAIQPLINQIVAYPLSEFTGQMKTIDWSKAPVISAPAATDGGETKWVVPEKFFDQFGEALDIVPPQPGEEALYSQFRALLKIAERNPEIKKLLTEVAVEQDKVLVKDFLQWKYNGKPAGNGWNRSQNNAEWGLDYYNRGSTARSNIFDNRPNETQYFYTDTTTAGEALDGTENYQVTFPKGELPPVKGFWSLTLYNKEHFFHPNELNRYSLGTKNKTLKYGEDGSLTLYVGNKNPGPDKESNWLPAPEGPFSLYIRAYWGDDAIHDGSWKPPIVKMASTASSSSMAQSRFDALANLPLKENRPTAETAQTLRDELLFQRATQTYLWAMPLLNTMGMRDGFNESFGTGYNIMGIWEKRLDARTLITTPNSDLIYGMVFEDLSKTGPLVFEAPPKLQGILLDFWQRPIPVDGGKFFGDVGLPGPDGGAGGKFLILPPSYEGEVPDGYYVYRSATNNIFIFLRSFYQSLDNIQPAVDVLKQSILYPLGKKEGAKPMEFKYASGKPHNMLPRTDLEAFNQLKWLVDAEGANLGEADSLGTLAGIGIIKGKPFEPDAHAKAILTDAAKTAYKTSRVIGMESKVGDVDLRVFKDRQWVNPVNNLSSRWPDAYIDLTWADSKLGYRNLDARVWMFTDYYSISPGMVSMTPGKGAFYYVAFKDAAGEWLRGEDSYKLNLPPNIPAALFWSVTLYEAENASGLANGQPFPSLGKLNKPVENADGSTDIYIGPKAPADREGNWLATVPGKGYFVILRLYAPTEPALDLSWKPGDIEKAN